MFIAMFITIVLDSIRKSTLAARCCHLANDLTNVTGDRQTNEQTNRKNIAIA